MKCEICGKDRELVRIYVKFEKDQPLFSPDPFPESTEMQLCKDCRQRLAGSFPGCVTIS